MHNVYITNVTQLTFIAYLSMYMEEIYCITNNISDTTQRDKYLQFIGEIKDTTFEIALDQYLKLSKTDTGIDKFTDDMLITAENRARENMKLLIY